jgi:hypothetical protein
MNKDNYLLYKNIYLDPIFHFFSYICFFYDKLKNIFDAFDVFPEIELNEYYV